MGQPAIDRSSVFGCTRKLLGKHLPTSRRLAAILGFCLPLGISPALILGGFPPQLTVIRLVTLAVLIWLIAHRAEFKLSISAKRVVLVMFLVIAYAFLSLAWTQNVALGIRDLVSLAFAFATALVILVMIDNGSGEFSYFVRGLAGGLWLQVILALLESRTTLVFASFPDKSLLPELRAGSTALGTFGNPNDLGGFLLLSIPVLLYGLRLRIFKKSSTRTSIYFVILASVLIGLAWLENSRSFQLGAFLLLSGFAFEKLLSRRPLMRISSFFLLGGLLVPVLQKAIEKMIELLGLRDNSNSFRLSLLMDALEISKSSVGLGIGIGGESALIDANQIPSNFHNIFAQLSVELGVITGILFLSLLFVPIFDWVAGSSRNFRVSPEACLTRAMIAIGLLIFGVTSSSVLDNPLYWSFTILAILLPEMELCPISRGWRLDRRY